MSKNCISRPNDRRRHIPLAVSLLLSLFLLLPAVVSAQVLYGALTGNVADRNSAVLPGAKITALNTATGVSQEATADSSGLYRLSNLTPGVYKVSIAAQGFRTLISNNVRINANTVVRIDALLEVAAASEQVVITGAPPELQTDKADVHTQIEAKQISSLPITSTEGRSFQALYKIIPGAGVTSESNSQGANPQRAMTTNVNGASTQANGTRIDGVTDSYPWLPANVAYVPPADAIETVNVVTNSFDPEQGNAGGAAINVAIKTGTNAFHGTVHEFHTDNALRAHNYFDPAGARKNKNIQNQYGYTFGGPIVKNKLFFFTDLEWTKQRLFGLKYVSLPTTAMLNGDFSAYSTKIYDPLTGSVDGSGRQQFTCNGVANTICANRFDAASQKLIALIKNFESTHTAVNTGIANNYYAVNNTAFNRWNMDNKVSYIPNAKSSIWGRYSISQNYILDPTVFGTDLGGDATNGGQPGTAQGRIQVVGLGGTYAITPNLLVDGNIGYTRQRLNAYDSDLGKDYGTSVLGINGTNLNNSYLYSGMPAFQISNFSNLGNASTGNPFLFRDNQYVTNGNISWVKGRHGLRAGFEFDRSGLNHFQPQGGAFQTARGTFKFSGVSTALRGGAAPNGYNSFADFILGLTSEEGKAVQINNPNSLRFSIWSWYVRDSWQVTQKLTVNYGVRWEYYPMATSDKNGARILNPSDMIVYIGGVNGVPMNSFVDTGSGLWLPRLGVAYRLDDKTVVRLGYGMSADSNNYRYLRNAYPAVTISDYQNYGGNAYAPAASLTGVNATGVYSALTVGLPTVVVTDTSSGKVPLPNNTSTTTMARNFRRGYTNTFNLTLQRDFNGFIAEAGYVGSRGIRPLTNMNINASCVGCGVAGRSLNAANPGRTWADINMEVPWGNSYYDSLQAKLTRHFSHGLDFGVVYTRSKAIDFSDNEELNYLLFPYNGVSGDYRKRARGLASFDRPNNLQFYGTYQLPFGKGRQWLTQGWGNKIAGGWQFNWVMSKVSGSPLTVTADGTSLNAPGNTQTADLIAPISYLGRHPISGCTKTNLSCLYFDPSSFAQPTGARFGTSGRDILRGPGFFNLDLSVFRDFKINERFNFQFRCEAFGATNTPQFGNPNTSLTASNFGAITSASGNRVIWLGGKLSF